MPSASITKIFLAIAVGGSLLTAGKLFHSGLFRRYRVFTVFCLALAGDLLYPILLPQKSLAYFYIWVITEPLLRILYVLVVLELCRLILEHYKGIYSLGRWALYASSALGAIISILTLLPHITPVMPQHTRLLGYVYGFNRGVDLSLVIIICGMLAFLSRIPVILSRNLAVHAGLYSVYFFSESLYGLGWKILGLKTYAWLDTVFQGVTACCLVAWLFLLTPEGERIPARHIKFSAEYESRALGKLDALNQTLLKINRS